MWDLILVTAILLAACVYVGKHYVGKLTISGAGSSNNSHEPSGCCQTCACGNVKCHSRKDCAEGKCGDNTVAIDTDVQPKGAGWEGRNG